MRAKRWVIASPDTERVRVLSRETGYTPLTAAVLSARGIDTPQAAADYLSCDVRGLHDPFGLTDMDKAVEVVREVIDRGEKMVVYGDYDVDGITATCTLVDYLRSKGAKCEYYIPNRLTDGYGLTRPAMEQLYEQGTRLLITVDSGITANEEIAVARELGMQVVITDHHECHENLPDAQAVVDCKRTDDTYPFSSLAGVGVAFKLICALEGDTLSMLDRYADLVALGTVADVMPIVGENRIIVAEGLKKAVRDGEYRSGNAAARGGDEEQAADLLDHQLCARAAHQRGGPHGKGRACRRAVPHQGSGTGTGACRRALRTKQAAPERGEQDTRADAHAFAPGIQPA